VPRPLKNKKNDKKERREFIKSNGQFSATSRLHLTALHISKYALDHLLTY